MTTRYRVEYALKTHRRDQFIEWIKGLLAVPFVLCSQPTGAVSEEDVVDMAGEAHRRYSEIMRDVETMIDHHISRQSLSNGSPRPSKLSMLVPSAGPFFTRLPLASAFAYQDGKRNISSRRYVAPSFNDVRLVLNSAQLMAVTAAGLQLATFDGDVTLYDDGASLKADSEVVPRILGLLRAGVKVGIVTAAGYTTAERYHHRLKGLLDALREANDVTAEQKANLVVMGGEANYLFVSSVSSPYGLRAIPAEEWRTPAMKPWHESDISSLLDAAESALRDCVRTLRLPAEIIRKPRARILDLRASEVPFCAFNGGRDVFVDIGDKSWGVAVVQAWFGGVAAGGTLHVGDQFLSAGANDFKARSVGTTAWVASPAETVELLDELGGLMGV
ncbi:IMP-specific 5'-nucleotidase 1 [Ophiocordyceps camponoti-floridani]|uniref:IMP-specific 5'-nucleotidase 1 n=1 Tax=Ophiocordyceps camponoti-floridani TaxID=2030778 RepID=A0A8H4Q2M8_9HYPO|nr:IMP-specific 5'-nucleotidase 1 [Ophiocordyceps camponoti-floridani]